jgi:hypothetical protein
MGALEGGPTPFHVSGGAGRGLDPPSRPATTPTVWETKMANIAPAAAKAMLDWCLLGDANPPRPNQIFVG